MRDGAQALSHGERIKNISFDQPPSSTIQGASGPPATAGGSDSIPWDEFTIVTAKDIPGEKLCRADSQRPNLYLADEIVNHPEEPIVLLAHLRQVLARRSAPSCAD